MGSESLAVTVTRTRSLPVSPLAAGRRLRRAESGVQLERQAAAAAAAAESPATARRPPTLYGGGDGSRSRANTFRRTVAEPRQGRRRTRTRRRVEIYLQSVTGSANTTRAIKPPYTHSYLVQTGGGPGPSSVGRKKK
jgi:nucleoside-diphosphate-sugar epimerase